MSQGLLEDGSLIPMFCTAHFTAEEVDEDAGIYEGEPCLDSSSLIWDEV